MYCVDMIKQVMRIKQLTGKTVLVRIDANVPIQKNKILDDSKLRSHLPLITWLIRKKAKVVLLTHLGRPQGTYVPSLRLDSVRHQLSKLLKKNVQKIATGNWGKEQHIRTQLQQLKPGQVALCDNLRFSKGEEENNPQFAQFLASLGNIFVLDGFAVSHRDAASVSGICAYLPSYAGPLVHKEIQTLSRVLHSPKQSCLVILGGAKSETKIPVIQHLYGIAHHILLGGTMVNTYLSSMGYGVGSSLVDTSMQEQMRLCGKKKRVVLPVDLIVGNRAGTHHRVVDVQRIPHKLCNQDEAILDIGPKTVALFGRHIEKANTIIWNGAMGYIEQAPYNIGTMHLAKAIAAQSTKGAHTVVGGGETNQIIHTYKLEKYIDVMSTGGGAMLTFLSGESLPGIIALDKMVKKKRI